MAQAPREHGALLPERPVNRLTRPFERFLHIQAAAGLVLLAATLVALGAANSAFGEAYGQFWESRIAIRTGLIDLDYPLWYWVNDGLMTIFFFVIGLEIKRELVAGELRDRKNVVLPLAAAVGGATVPMVIYLAIVADGAGRNGWAIPMATDIAFVVGCLALLGSRVGPGLKVLMLSLAIIDDIIAVLVIAIFFSAGIKGAWLAGAVAGFGAVLLMQRAGVRSIGVYGLAGTVIWLCALKSGVHPTVAGVLLGLLTPAKAWLAPGALSTVATSVLERLRRDPDVAFNPEQRAALEELAFASAEAVSPLERLEARLHPWVGFVIMPIFALANAGIAIDPSRLGDTVSMAVAAGLMVGKPVGIMAAVWLTVRVAGVRLPAGVGWAAVAGGGCLAGIGFTMALFLASLSLTGDTLDSAKAGVLMGSAASMALGLSLLRLGLRPGSASSN